MSDTEDEATPGDDGSVEVDLALRAVSALFPTELATALLPAGTVIAKPTWVETQVALQERRLDRLLAVDVSNRRRWLHVEWMLAWTGDLPYRVWEYHNLAATAAMNEARSHLKLAREKDRKARLAVPTVESTVVLLTGRDAPWESEYV
ncbi:MAG: hypothetical protein HY909_24730, partial [Deltaproteobacteria bacterium]|nr:hypothetical protein [Deltaproteobacteria bacterium]